MTRLTPFALCAALTLAACAKEPTNTESEAAKPDATASAPAETAATPTDEKTDEAAPLSDLDAARFATKSLGKALGGRISQAMQAGGPLKAIDVCHLEAPEIAATVSAGHGFTVRRTALKVRNPNNAPDEFEQQGLAYFQQAIDAGEDPKTLEFSQTVDAGETSQFRYMKPIMMGGPCASCHGAELSPDIAAAIAERYPDDQATGFAPGALRGAFSVVK